MAPPDSSKLWLLLLVASASAGSQECTTLQVATPAECITLVLQNVDFLAPNALVNMTMLQQFQISDSAITSLSADLFMFSPNLTHLALGPALPNIITLPAALLSYAPALFVFYMTETSVAALPATLFNGNPVLWLTQMVGNKLTTVPATLFAETPLMAHISLNNNKITGIPYETFNGLTALITLYIGGNALFTCIDTNVSVSSAGAMYPARCPATTATPTTAALAAAAPSWVATPLILVVVAGIALPVIVAVVRWLPVAA